MKLYSDDLQCCWCDRQYLNQDDDDFGNKQCRPFKISTMREDLQAELENNQKHKNRIEFKCNCYNKDGKNVKASYNTVTGDVLIE